MNQESTPGAAGRYSSPIKTKAKQFEEYKTPERLREGNQMDRLKHDEFYTAANAAPYKKKDRLDCLFDQNERRDFQ